MLIRKAQKEDMPQVLELIQELAVFEKEPNAVVITADDLVRDGFQEYPLFHCFVAEKEHEIVGIALYYYRYSTWKGKTIHLEDLIVKQDKRGLGIGNALYTEVIRKAHQYKVRRIEWAVLDWNTPAIEFYKKTGAIIFDDWRVAQMDENAIAAFLQKSK